MTNFSFTKPEPIKTNEKKTTIWGKIWAGINLISLLGDALIPKGAKDNMPVKWRNIIILIFIVVLGYLIGCGIYINVLWIIHQVQKASFSLGDGFYYFGLLPIVLMVLDFFNMQEKLADHALQKKIISTAIKNVGKEKNVLKGTGKDFKKKSNSLSILSSVISLISFVWVVWGAIFYERMLFGSIIILSIVFSIASAPVKNIKHLKILFTTEIIANILLITAILINHFFTL